MMIPCDNLMNSLIEKIGEVDLQIVELALKEKIKEEMVEQTNKKTSYSDA